jgi:hypothetical protein
LGSLKLIRLDLGFVGLRKLRTRVSRLRGLVLSSIILTVFGVGSINLSAFDASSLNFGFPTGLKWSVFGMTSLSLHVPALNRPNSSVLRASPTLSGLIDAIVCDGTLLGVAMTKSLLSKTTRVLANIALSRFVVDGPDLAIFRLTGVLGCTPVPKVRANCLEMSCHTLLVDLPLKRRI